MSQIITPAKSLQGPAGASANTSTQSYHQNREFGKFGCVTVWPTPLQREIAHSIALARCAANDGFRRPEQDHGSQSNARRDFDGALAELGTYMACEAAGIELSGVNLFRLTPPAGPDCVLNGTLSRIRIDVKSIAAGSAFLMLNEMARLRKAILLDAYLPVAIQQDGSIRFYEPVPAGEVAAWTLRTGKSLYRSIAVSQLSPLRSFRDLRNWRAK